MRTENDKQDSYTYLYISDNLYDFQTVINVILLSGRKDKAAKQ